MFSAPPPSTFSAQPRLLLSAEGKKDGSGCLYAHFATNRGAAARSLGGWE